MGKSMKPPRGSGFFPFPIPHIPFPFFHRHTFARGVHPDAQKSTAGSPIRRMPFASRMILPLAQHIGKPAVPLVRAGEEVVRGQPIAKADGFLSVPIHAPADGVIDAIELKASARGPWVESIVLRVYEGSTQQVGWSQPFDIENASGRDIIQAIQDSGMVGLGGATFPSHAKLSVPAEHKIHTLIVNGCECEPYLTCDHRLMLEYPADLMVGIRLAMRAIGAERAIIGVEDNKLDAVEAIRKCLPADGSITVRAVPTKYPQGAEKMLIKSLLNVEVPPGKLPMHVGVVVNNVGTLAQLGHDLAELAEKRDIGFLEDPGLCDDRSPFTPLSFSCWTELPRRCAARIDSIRLWHQFDDVSVS
jgi:electron transport complex protein RnfC